MSYKDLMHGNKPHTDSPEQAAARRAAQEEAKARADAKAASKQAGRGEKHDAPARRQDPSSK